MKAGFQVSLEESLSSGVGREQAKQLQGQLPWLLKLVCGEHSIRFGVKAAPNEGEHNANIMMGAIKKGCIWAGTDVFQDNSIPLKLDVELGKGKMGEITTEFFTFLAP